MELGISKAMWNEKSAKVPNKPVLGEPAGRVLKGRVLYARPENPYSSKEGFKKKGRIKQGVTESLLILSFRKRFCRCFDQS